MATAITHNESHETPVVDSATRAMFVCKRLEMNEAPRLPRTMYSVSSIYYYSIFQDHLHDRYTI